MDWSLHLSNESVSFDPCICNQSLNVIRVIKGVQFSLDTCSVEAVFGTCTVLYSCNYHVGSQG
jgi:hypothetical protein